MRRDEIELRVDALARAHEGRGFVEAVRAFSNELGVADREVLGQVLMSRAGREGGMEALRELEERRWWKRFLLPGRRPR